MQKRHVAIFYETKEGHTATVADRIRQIFDGQGFEVTVKRCRDASPSDLEADFLLLGSSIHMGKHNAKTVRFVKKHIGKFKSKPSGFFLVCLTARSNKPEHRAIVESYVHDFISLTGWEPPLRQVFAGALLYTQYNFIKRKIMRAIAEKEGGDTDISKDYIYTDWQAVEAFAAEVAKQISR